MVKKFDHFINSEFQITIKRTRTPYKEHLQNDLHHQYSFRLD